MSKVRAKGEKIRRFILDNVEKYPSDIGKLAAEKFVITRQAVNKHLRKLIDEKALSETGKTKGRAYQLSPLVTWEKSYPITADLAEDLVWRNDISAIIGQLPDNVINIWYYDFTEMFNNAIDHSAGSEITVSILKTATYTSMLISDNGVGIFKKIQAALNLLDERHAIFELHKGKLTTDPKRHSGQGIFFTSRFCDSFDILSGGVHFSHNIDKVEDWLIENKKPTNGTCIFMKVHNHTARTTKKIFDQYASGEDYGFNKTVVPVRLAQYGTDQLISRSQAKRLLARVELFEIIMFDFTDVDSIGQAFADEIFRVFAQQHAKMQLIAVHANTQVENMISRAKAIK